MWGAVDGKQGSCHGLLTFLDRIQGSFDRILGFFVEFWALLIEFWALLTEFFALLTECVHLIGYKTLLDTVCAARNDAAHRRFGVLRFDVSSITYLEGLF